MPAAVIANVSDTARWVAMYRAMESERPDALFHDNLARKLAGKQGEAIVETLPGARWGAWSIAVRTVLFDEVILCAVQQNGVDLVLNLAAGLDARPYRLPLPSTLRWVEIDLPGIIEHKNRVLADEQPRCQVERIVTDLSDVDARRRAFSRVGAEGSRLLVLTEGLVMYLTAEQIASLASDLADVPTAHEWVTDLIGPTMKRMMNLAWWRELRAASSTFQFAPAEGGEFFRPFGWRVHETRSFHHEMFRIGRVPPLSQPWERVQPLLPQAVQKRLDAWGGVFVLQRA